MAYKSIIFLLLIFLGTSRADERSKFDDYTPILRVVKLFLNNVNRQFTKNVGYSRLLEKIDKSASPIPSSTPFPCDITGKLRSDEVPTNAHEVRPGDIDLIGSLGDSLSAGTGTSAVSFVQVAFSEERGRSFSAGGEKTWRSYLTLPNILKVFNPKLFGFALKNSVTIERASQFNPAENGALSSHMPFMVKELVRRIKNDRRVDLNNHWKMITMMIGDNDFCLDMCSTNNYYDVLEKHRKDLLYVLRYLKDNLPRTIVNIIPPPRLDLLWEMKKLPLICYPLRSFECPCIEGLVYVSKRKIFSDIMKKWQQIDFEVSNMHEFDLNDFTVIPHSFTTNITLPNSGNGKFDLSYLGPDCFHFSEKTQARLANALWNSLLEPFGRKSTGVYEVFSKFLCPTNDRKYIFTRRNSG